MAVNLITFPSQSRRYYTSIGGCKWDDEFTVSDELLPLLKVYSGMNNMDEDILLMSQYGSSNFRWSITPQTEGSKTSKHSYRRRGSPIFNVYTGLYSAIGYGDVEYENSKVGIGRQPDWAVKADKYDVLILGVLKKPYRYKFDKGAYGNSMIVREKDIILLLNEEKFNKNDKFMKVNYTTTVRTYLKAFVKRVRDEGIIEIRSVSDEYISSFIKQGVDLNITSVIQLMKTQNKVVNKVFDTLIPSSITV